MKKPNRLIMGSAIGLAAVLTALDHTKHTLPEASVAAEQEFNITIDDEEDSSPCSMGEESSPCGLGD